MKLSRMAYTLLSIMVLTTTVIACGAPAAVPPPAAPSAPPAAAQPPAPAASETPAVPAPATPDVPATPQPASTPDTYPNAGLLVSTRWLNENLADSNITIIDARSASDYNAGHVKNAINLTPSTLDTISASVPTDKTDLINTADLSAMLGQLWISDKAKVIVYGAGVDPNAGRIFWLLEYLGHKDVHILDGGFNKWKADNLAAVTEKAMKDPAVFTASVDDTRLAVKSEVLTATTSADTVIVDSRNATDYIVKRIPGALNILTADYLNADGTVKSYADLKGLLEGKGITSQKTVITSCYVGYRSSQGYFIFRLMGYPVSNYDGSTTEWFADASLPTQP